MVKTFICEAPDCDREVYSSNACRMHYQRMRRNGQYEPLSTAERARRIRAGQGLRTFTWPSEKRCPRCEQTKQIDEFSRYRNKNGEWRPFGWCKVCHRESIDQHRLPAQEERRKKRAAEKAAAVVNGGFCIQEGCNKKQTVAHMCSAHYNRKRRGDDLGYPIRTKKQSHMPDNEDVRLCTICDEVSPVENFYINTNGKYRSHCKGCTIRLNKIRNLVGAGSNSQEALSLAMSYEGMLRKKALAYLESKGIYTP